MDIPGLIYIKESLIPNALKTLHSHREPPELLLHHSSPPRILSSIHIITKIQAVLKAK
jgi:hypothetical protein